MGEWKGDVGEGEKDKEELGRRGKILQESTTEGTPLQTVSVLHLPAMSIFSCLRKLEYFPQAGSLSINLLRFTKHGRQGSTLWHSVWGTSPVISQTTTASHSV